MAELEYWLHGPVQGVPGLLQPVAHALLQAREEVQKLIKDLPEELAWQRPGNMASIAFHLQHLAGVIDRLFTYARGEQLNSQQLEYLAAEGKEDNSIRLDILSEDFDKQVDKAIAQLKLTDESTLTDLRGVGRKQIPSTVAGLLFHAAEHTMRHTGQLIVTVRILKAKLI